uniref:Uncharacterized protein n=1 Tax=Arundo donax TaxID=35708 RepID=A0A0A9GGX8_ARUDO
MLALGRTKYFLGDVVLTLNATWCSLLFTTLRLQ